jgi:hypothetical protein
MPTKKQPEAQQENVPNSNNKDKEQTKVQAVKKSQENRT